MNKIVGFAMALLTAACVYPLAAEAECPSYEQYLKDLPTQEISSREAADLSHMRQEEKLARDVYQYLYGLWNYNVFKNIGSSEQQHMDALKIILDKYGLDDPVAGYNAGDFADPTLQAIYDQLTQQGAASLVDALDVGATIEDLDIYDLKAALAQTDNQDIKTAYQNLMKGSRNHLRSFAGLLASYGVTYQAQYLSADEVAAILAASHERGVYDADGNPLNLCTGAGGSGYGNGGSGGLGGSAGGNGHGYGKGGSGS